MNMWRVDLLISCMLLKEGATNILHYLFCNSHEFEIASVPISLGIVHHC